MDLSTITMPRHEARLAFLDYRRALQQRHNDEDEAIMRGYRAMAAGHQLLNLREAITAGGQDELGCPRLAVMRADLQWCYLGRGANGDVTFQPQRYIDGRRSRGVYRFPAATLPPREWREIHNDRRAIVPTIPPQFRPTHSLVNYELLWEATWEKVPRPPGDPALLKRITGDLFAVLAIWDLTRLEQAVLGARVRS